MALGLTELQNLRDTIVRAIASQTLRARGADGEEVQYRSVQEGEAALAVVDAEILRAQGGPGSRISYAQHQRGDGFLGGGNRGGCR